ncbi:hypothetical protein L2E82_13043 [Cichorium intybus]|uniref:Uncharacterized protein n=1 Tax=Cichorium intybus TaxID=13427 RepID=A0ACB9GJR5_CICIN|nr:hypothetical protein L2E82_13043 [Cichorium intybus]
MFTNNISAQIFIEDDDDFFNPLRREGMHVNVMEKGNVVGNKAKEDGMLIPTKIFGNVVKDIKVDHMETKAGEDIKLTQMVINFSKNDRGLSRAKGPTVQRKPLKHRDYEVDLDSRLGKTQVLSYDAKCLALISKSGPCEGKEVKRTHKFHFEEIGHVYLWLEPANCTNLQSLVFLGFYR